MASATSVNGSRLVTGEVDAEDVKALQNLGDALREQLGSGVGVLAATFGEGKNSLLVVVTDDLRDRGIRADVIVRDVAAVGGGRGGGKPHMAQAGMPDVAGMRAALESAPGLIRAKLTEHS